MWSIDDNGSDDSKIEVVMDYLKKDKVLSTRRLYLSPNEIESFYVPIVRIVNGIDSMSHALLYVQDTYVKQAYLRMIDEGTHFLEIRGLKVTEEGKWSIE
jgi:hypothetical protein